MKRVQLSFPQVADVWNFLEKTKMPKGEVRDNTISGFFSEEELTLARENFKAEIEAYTPAEAPLKVTPEAPQAPAVATLTGQPVALTGQSGTVYNGTIYTKGAALSYIPTHAIIGLSNSVAIQDDWQHAVNAFYKSDDVQSEKNRFEARDDLSHFIVLPMDPSARTPIDEVDDLTRAYIHQ